MFLVIVGFVFFTGKTVAAEVNPVLKDAQQYINDTFARDVMYVAAVAAYADNPEICLRNRLRGAYVISLKKMSTYYVENCKIIVVFRKYKAECGPLPFTGLDYCYGYSALSDFHKAIILGFRGADHLIQFIMKDFQAIFEKKVSLLGGGKVGRYFHDAFNAVWTAGMYRDLIKLRKKYEDYEIWLTGHSLGGSMSAIAAHEIAANSLFDDCQIITVTFGEPRTGDMAFAVSHNKLVGLNRNMLTETLSLLYAKIWYNNSMDKGDEYRFCTKSESKRCSEGELLNISPFDHFNYYKHDVREFALHGCVRQDKEWFS
ncbi:unnamed protein product [Enterobius vermicularis]|uniref:Lipase_3 domain-containing protein n=1 Tax=Enterobius vermicularis TaxID=51028 RepID=A0A0N4VBM2_ENTVE|nr:unnamed protein product [Enterobius vermicularis]